MASQIILCKRIFLTDKNREKQWLPREAKESLAIVDRSPQAKEGRVCASADVNAAFRLGNSNMRAKLGGDSVGKHDMQLDIACNSPVEIK